MAGNKGKPDRLRIKEDFGKPKYKCDYCSEEFINKQNYLNHKCFKEKIQKIRK